MKFPTLHFEKYDQTSQFIFRNMIKHHITFLKIWSNITFHIFLNNDDFRQHFPDQNLSHSICSHLEVHQQRSTLTSTSTMKNKNKHILKGNSTSCNIWQHLFTPWLGWGGKGVQQVQYKYKYSTITSTTWQSKISQSICPPRFGRHGKELQQVQVQQEVHSERKFG